MIEGSRPHAYRESVRRGSLLLVCFCASGLFLGASFLGESSPTASAGGGGAFEGQVERMIEVRQTMTQGLMDRGREIKYGLERLKDEVEDLVP